MCCREGVRPGIRGDPRTTAPCARACRCSASCCGTATPRSRRRRRSCSPGSRPRPTGRWRRCGHGSRRRRRRSPARAWRRSGCSAVATRSSGSTPLLSDDDPYRRWGAAIALARIAGREAPDPTLEVLLDAAIGATCRTGRRGRRVRQRRHAGLRDPQPAPARPARPRRDARGAARLRAARPRRRAARRSRSGPTHRSRSSPTTSSACCARCSVPGWVVDWQLRNLGLPRYARGHSTPISAV